MLQRPDWSARSLLFPHNEHPFLATVVVYKVLAELFGIESTLPFRIANVCLLICVAWLVMVLIRRRLGGWAGLIAAAVLLFMGAAWEDLLWPIEISFLGSTAAGLGAFCLLDRDRPPPDLAVCALLVLSLCFSALGLVFIAGAATDVLLRGSARPLRDRLRRAWIVAIPLVLFAAWYVAYGHEAESNVTFDNLLALPGYVWEAAATVPAALLGLLEVDADHGGALIGAGDWGPPLLVALLIGGSILVARRPSLIGPRFWMFSATALTFWVTSGLNRSPGRDPGASRYQLIGGLLMLLIASELLRDRPLRRAWLWVATALAGLAVVSGVAALREGERVLRAESDLARAELSALELAREQVSPWFSLIEPVAGTTALQTVIAGQYFAAVDRWGSPVDAPGDLLEASEENRARADYLLLSALGGGLEPAESRSQRGCHPQAPAAEVKLPAEGLVVAARRGTVDVALRRFALASYAELGRVGARGVYLRLPPDAASQPWIVRFGGGSALVCPPR